MSRARASIIIIMAAASSLATARVLAGDEPIKLKSTLDSKVDAVARDVADKRVALAKKLEKAGLARDAWDELRAAIRIDPQNRHAREKLGFKKKGSEWEGGDPPPAAAKEPLEKSSPELAKERGTIRIFAASKLSALAKRAKEGGLDADARRVAARAVDEEPTQKEAHEVLGQTKADDDTWATKRELDVRKAWKDALEKADAGEEKGTEDELEKLIGISGIKRRETKHCIILATPSSGASDLPEIAKILEATYAAFHYFFFDVRGQGFEVAGDGAKVATGGDALGELEKPRFLIVSGKDEHQQFCEKLIKDSGFKAVAKMCAGTSLGGPKSRIYDGYFPREWHAEWAAGNMLDFLAGARLEKDSFNPPRYMHESLRRWFSGYASRMAQIYTVAPGSTVSKRQIEGGPFGALRAVARGSIVDGSADELKIALAKGPNDLIRLDIAMGGSFVDFALAHDRAGLVKYLKTYDAKASEAPHTQLEKAFGRAVEKIEDDWREWVREEY